jgi:hypothetical protein
MLARLDLSRETVPFTVFEGRIKEQAERMVIVISPDWLDDFQELLERLGVNRDLIWLCPCRRENEVKIRASLKARTIIAAEMI